MKSAWGLKGGPYHPRRGVPLTPLLLHAMLLHALLLHAWLLRHYLHALHKLLLVLLSSHTIMNRHLGVVHAHASLRVLMLLLRVLDKGLWVLALHSPGLLWNALLG